ncbi:MAG: putative cyclohydrolase 1 type 2, partial [Pseudomonadota bacterium]
SIQKIVSGVTASRELIDAAIEAKADAIFVHHGLFWRGQDGRVVGWMKERLQRLLANEINLYAYHLPLDAHPQLGNNAQLGTRNWARCWVCKPMLGAAIKTWYVWGSHKARSLFQTLQPCQHMSKLVWAGQ